MIPKLHPFEYRLRFSDGLPVVCVFLVWLVPFDVVAAQQGSGGGQAQAVKSSQADIDFFENEIRPILVEHCLTCHGNDEKKLRGGLHLTSRADILRGGDSGPAMVTGKPDESRLIAAVRYEDFEMPPQGQLKPSEIDALVKWVEMGAPDPRKTLSNPVSNEIDMEAGRKFWSFAPRSDSPPPETSNKTWPVSSIDQFVLAQLEANAISTVEDASRESLIRRVYLALIGLPPTVDQIDGFIHDRDEMEIALAKVVDELLASKHFGERWGRHWLDVVRFAESSGGGRSLMFPEAWRFRDYVIDSFNADKPFDQFIREQIAGDLLSSDSHHQKTERLVATGMLALGPTNYEQQDKELLAMEVIDEQVDTIGRAFLGLTLGCARCHDHKFDPIPMTDYYALAGIFGSTVSLVDGNVSSYVIQPLATEQELVADRQYRARVAKLGKQLEAAQKELEELGGNSGNVELHSNVDRRNSSDLAGIVIDDRDAKIIGQWVESTSLRPFVDGHYLHDENIDKGKKQVVFTPNIQTGGYYEVRLSYGASGNRASNVPVTIVHQDGQAEVIVNQSQSPPIDGLFVSLGTYRFEADNRSSVTISNAGTDGHVIVDAVQFLIQESDQEKLVSKPKQVPVATSDPVAKTWFESDAPPKPASRSVQLERTIKALDDELRRMKKNGPPPVAVAMSVKDSEQPSDGYLHIRGSVRNLGPMVQRGFISVCCDNPKPNLESHESGRLQLADWIASPQHPLTARVYVNRIWRHLFGQGLVRTVDNFGFVGQAPSHPELLDYLANEFVSNGWSTKQLIRQIVLSHVYRLSSQDDPVGRAKDDTNRLLWRANRRRVDAEVLRDSILFVSGELDLQPGGLTIRKISQYDLGYEFDTVRRSVYVPAFRNSMLDLFEVFDFANPNLVTGDRNTSTLPTQALFLMNNPMIIEQSRKMAARLLSVSGIDDHQRVQLAYRQAIGRPATPGEMHAALAYLESLESSLQDSNPVVTAWSSFCHALFASLDFRYVD